MHSVIRNNKGFTLLEIIVVLAVLGALASMLTPVVFRYIDDANRARAQADVTTIATAIQRMYNDTSRWPFYADGDAALAYNSTTDETLLLSSPNVCAAGAVVDDHADSPSDASSGSSWSMTDGTDCATISAHLIENTPGYDTTSTFPRRWRGPYTDTIPELDSWGKSYIVNIGNAGPPTTGDWVIVASAGPDGILQTDAAADLTSNPAAAGDDIIARVR